MTRSVGRVPQRVVRLLAGVAVVAGILVVDSPAHACSCVRMDVGQRLPDADGAFVGTYVGRESIGTYRFAVTFDVERVVKGAFGPTAVVRTSDTGGPCGIEPLNGRRMGLLLDRTQHGVWTSNLCQQVSPDELLAFAPDARPPDPSVDVIDPAPGVPAWTFVLVGVGVAVAAMAAVARRPRARA